MINTNKLFAAIASLTIVASGFSIAANAADPTVTAAGNSNGNAYGLENGNNGNGNSNGVANSTEKGCNGRVDSGQNVGNSTNGSNGNYNGGNGKWDSDCTGSNTGDVNACPIFDPNFWTVDAIYVNTTKSNVYTLAVNQDLNPESVSYAITQTKFNNTVFTPSNFSVNATTGQVDMITGGAFGVYYVTITATVDPLATCEGAKTFTFLLVVPTKQPNPSYDPVNNPNVPKDLTPLYPEPKEIKGSIQSVAGAKDYSFSPNSQANGWVLTADSKTSPWGLTIAGTDSTGTRLSTLNKKNEIIFQPAYTYGTFTGYGFKNNSIAKAWIFSQPVALGDLAVDATGKFVGTLKLPNLTPGLHHVQIAGYSPTDEIRWATVPVIVASTPTIFAKTTVTFAGDSAVLTTAAKDILSAVAGKISDDYTSITITADGWVKPTNVKLSADMKLAAARAASVVAYLKTKGINASFVANAAGRGKPVNTSRKVVVTVAGLKVVYY